MKFDETYEIPSSVFDRWSCSNPICNPNKLTAAHHSMPKLFYYLSFTYFFWHEGYFWTKRIFLIKFYSIRHHVA